MHRLSAEKGMVMAKYNDWTRGQIEALLNILGEDNALSLLRDEVRVSFELIREFESSSSSEFFVPVGELLVLPASWAQYELGGFDSERIEVHMSGSFHKLVEKAQQEPKFDQISIVAFDIAKSRTDARIREALPRGHAFESRRLLLAALWQMLDQWLGGEESLLADNRRNNIFYISDEEALFVSFNPGNQHLGLAPRWELSLASAGGGMPPEVSRRWGGASLASGEYANRVFSAAA